MALPRPRLPRPAKTVAPEDLTGYWVSIVTEDWRWRMVTPAKGDYTSVPLNQAGRKAADAWDPDKDIGGRQPVQSVWRGRHHARAWTRSHQLGG